MNGWIVVGVGVLVLRRGALPSKAVECVLATHRGDRDRSMVRVNTHPTDCKEARMTHGAEGELPAAAGW